MRFLLRMQVLGRVPEIELSQHEFESLTAARDALSAGLAIEEKFEMLVSNYLELEKEALSLAADYMLRSPTGYEDFSETRALINRRLVNLLTTARLYVDHVLHHVNEIIGKQYQPTIEKLFSDEYDGVFGYRFMEALRNYVQHRGFPVHRISVPGNRVERTDGSGQNFIFSLEFTASTQMLLEDPCFKKAILDQSRNEIDLKKKSRVYVECLSRVNKRIRSIIAPALNESRTLIQATITRYQDVHGSKPLGLAAIERNESGATQRATPLLLDWDNIREALAKRNGEFVNLRNRCISSALRSEAKT